MYKMEKQEISERQETLGMPGMLEYEQIIGLIDHVAASGLSSFKYETEGLKLSMRGRQPAAASVSLADASRGNIQTAAVPVGKVPFAAETGLGTDGESAAGQNMVQAGDKIVTSPLVGTFYAAPAEGADPYVSVGDQVKKGQVLAIVEAMKLMNEIESDYDGVVKKILVRDGEPVEYGQPLFCLE